MSSELPLPTPGEPPGRATSARGAGAMPLRGREVLAVTPSGAYGGFNTSVHRVRALESLGADVHVVDSAPAGPSRLARLGARVRHQLFVRGLGVAAADTAHVVVRTLDAARRRSWDIIWLEKALCIGPRELRAIRASCPRAHIIGFAADDMCLRHNQSRQFVAALPHYDCFITTKPHAVAELEALGCARVLAVGNGFDPEAFHPRPLAAGDAERLGGDVGFIGTYESSRAELMLGLARAGLRVRVWGDGWRSSRARHENLRVEHRPLYFEDFSKACAAFKINLGFLRKLNRDRTTTRSVEIPACGGFMLAERTPEHLELFEEGREAEFFASPAELLRKCRLYLADEAARRSIARRGFERCIASGYSNTARLREAFRAILPK
jgi:spore maturation protein CgeB